MTELIENFKKLYQDYESMDLTKLDEIYSDAVIFKDPLHRTDGLSALRDYIDQMYQNINSCYFEYLDQLIGEHCAYIKWNMHYQHSKLGKKAITVRGMTQIQFHNRIEFHEDLYDLGALLYEHLPLFGRATRLVKKAAVWSIS